MLISIAVDFHSADVATRERFHLSAERIEALYGAARDESMQELALISTCNRTEVYAWVEDGGADSVEHLTQALVRRWVGNRKDARALMGIARRRSGIDVARHILRVAAGLESQVLGDGQILGQLKTAYRLANGRGTAGPVLHRLIETALRTGKRVATETSLSAGRNSIGAEAAAMALHRFGSLAHARVVVVGCGKTGERTARQLKKLGAQDVVLLNRTMSRAVELANAVGGRAAAWDTLHLELAMADAAIVATGAEAPLVQAALLRTCRENCGTAGYPLMLVDLSVPRNIEPAVREIEGISLVDLDKLHLPIVAAEEARRAAVPLANAIVEEELRHFMEWSSAAAARAVIRPLHDALVEVARREVEFAAGDSAVAERTADRIVAKLLARPMSALKNAIQRGESLDDLMLTMDQLFAEHGVRHASRTRAHPPTPTALDSVPHAQGA
ncbi:MAG: glutamyl-tRNA reductase [Gemmatimonadetes bacterium]|nr:glutamyl-tRNA reductase [Gemmatimonadota bacterium]